MWYFDAWYYYDVAPPYARNHKVFRFHANRTSLPNLYYGMWCSNRGSVLSQDGVDGGNYNLWPSLGPEDFARRWSHLQGYFVQSSPGVDNGTMKFWVNGVQIANEVGNFRTRASGGAAWDTLWFGNMLDHGSDGNCGEYPADAYTYWDDVYVDYSQARVEIGDAVTYAASRHREIQLPSSWSDGTVTITLNRGSFSNFTGLFLFVVDDAGNISPGYPLTATGPDTTPPVVSAVTPAVSSSGVAPDGDVSAVFSENMTASTITGTNFELRAAGSTLVPATVTYTSGTRTATLNPTAPLNVTAPYTVTVKGGSTGVKDSAGNAMAANYTWTFTTSTANGLVASYSFEEPSGTAVIESIRK